jgi:hypothetical protein
MSAEDDARAEVVSIAEAARDAENLKVIQQFGAFQNAKQVQPFRHASRGVECEGGFDVAVRARSTQNAYTGLNHQSTRREEGHDPESAGVELYAIAARTPRPRYGACDSKRRAAGFANEPLDGV